MKTRKDRTAACVIPATECIPTNTTASVRSLLTTVRAGRDVHGSGRAAGWFGLGRVGPFFVNYGRSHRVGNSRIFNFLINMFYFVVHRAVCILLMLAMFTRIYIF